MTGKQSSSSGRRRGKRKRKRCRTCDRQCKRVAEMQSGQTGTIERIDECVRAKASAMGVRPGKRLEVQTKQPFDGPVVISVGDSMTSLSRRYAQGIEVTVD
ncbi:MAG TPA: FeoA family protein [Natrialbaceae archaeon]|nr:FeoA family protein [Natrialbaceae archaeon]